MFHRFVFGVVLSLLVSTQARAQVVQEPDYGAVPATSVPEAAPPPATSGEQCFPSCRPGFLCHQGQCISACNPACPSGQTCTAAGQCAVDGGSVAAPPIPPPSAPVASGVGTAFPGTAAYAPQVARPRLGASLGMTIVGVALTIAGAGIIGSTDHYLNVSDCASYGDCTVQKGWTAGWAMIGGGLAITAIALPFLIVRAHRRRQWDREHAGPAAGLVLEPMFAQGVGGSRWGLRLSSSF